ncbi:MAG TPA: glutathione S-transferase family protein [Kofleriaceae bacterium]|nr:glutathione S-transferase family protein [Kofleriaceae bacterium]
MKLYGTTTSPFVRRVRIVAAELGVPFELIRTAGEEGQKTLRGLTPIWMVPIAEIDGEVVFDSHVIIEHLLRHHGYGPLRTAGGVSWLREQNLISAIDGALDSGVELFSLERGGVEAESAPYVVKQRDRVKSILTWLDEQLHGTWLTEESRLGLADIYLISALDWMIFRKRYPVETHEGLAVFLAAHAEHPSIKSTYPTE